MWGFISTDRRKIETFRKEMCDSQGKMGKTTYTRAAAPFASIKEQLKGYVKGKGEGSKQRHKQKKKPTRCSNCYPQAQTHTFERRANIPHPLPPNTGQAACCAEPGCNRSCWPRATELPKEHGAGHEAASAHENTVLVIRWGRGRQFPSA